MTGALIEWMKVVEFGEMKLRDGKVLKCNPWLGYSDIHPLFAHLIWPCERKDTKFNPRLLSWY